MRSTAHARWWLDPQYHIGSLATATRKIGLLNVLIGQTCILEVPIEETLAEIATRLDSPNSLYSAQFCQVPRLQFSRIELHMEATRQEAGYGEDLGGKRRP